MAAASKGTPAPVLAVFIDGLRPDAVERMPYVASLGAARRMRTELGYSITCYPSMFTGTRPEVHHSWFIWQRSPRTSPFRWLRWFGLHGLPDSPYVKYPLWRLTHVWARNPAFFSVPFPAFVPLRHWPQFDVSEKRFWDQDGWMPAPSIFERFRAAGIDAKVFGMDHTAHESRHNLMRHDPVFGDVTLLFFGDVDHVSHRHGQDSAEATQVLREVDAAIERWHKAAVEAGHAPRFLLWSDHGHSRIERKVDPYAVFASQGLDLRAMVHMIDANYIRFWPRDDDERARIEEIVSHLGDGFVIDDERAERYSVRMPDDRYGALIYYLDPPQAFDKGTLRILGRDYRNEDVSTHGYRPDLPEADATLLTDQRLRQPRPILQDIAATLLLHYGLPLADDNAGRSLW